MEAIPLDHVRDADPADAEACAAIYSPYVAGTAITFEGQPPTAEEMAARIAKAAATHAWLVLERRDVVVGYAYARPFAERDAYRWSCETSVYVAHDARGSGVGRALYSALLARLGSRGYRRAYAGMALPNDASARLHTALGFEPVGVFRRVGWKFGRWHDVAWMQLDLGDPTAPPGEIT
jgi:L-amino acid N-acyltransferase YncA